MRSMHGKASEMTELERAKHQLLKSFDYLFEFSGSGHMEVEMKILKRGQKEVLIRCGRGYRFVLDSTNSEAETNACHKQHRPELEHRPKSPVPEERRADRGAAGTTTDVSSEFF